MYEQRGGNQSAVDRRGVSVDDYVHALFGLTVQSAGKKVLMIGCGGGVLASMLCKKGYRVTVVDIDKTSFKVAKRFFGLPTEVACHVQDGLEFLQCSRRRFDVIVVDVFVGEKVPGQFFSPAFYAAVHARLRDTGFALMNVCLDRKSDPTADRLASGFRRAGASVRLLDGRGGERNAIVLTGRVAKLRAPVMTMPPETRVDEIRKELAKMRFRRYRAAPE